MALPEGTKLREGDVVALHATVKFDMDDDGKVFLRVPGHAACIVQLDEIAFIVRRAFNRGEQVKAHVPSNYPGEVLTIEAVSEDGVDLWLRRPAGERITLPASQVDLVEPEPEKVEDEDGEAAQ